MFCRRIKFGIQKIQTRDLAKDLGRLAPSPLPIVGLISDISSINRLAVKNSFNQDRTLSQSTILAGFLHFGELVLL